MILGLLSTYRKRIVWGIGIALVLSLVSLGYLYRKEIQHAAKQAMQIELFEQAQEKNMETIRTLEAENARQQKIMLERERRIREYRRQTTELKQDIAELETQNENVADWLAAPMPDALYDELHKDGSGDENGQD